METDEKPRKTRDGLDSRFGPCTMKTCASTGVERHHANMAPERVIPWAASLQIQLDHVTDLYRMALQPPMLNITFKELSWDSVSNS